MCRSIACTFTFILLGFEASAQHNELAAAALTEVEGVASEEARESFEEESDHHFDEEEHALADPEFSFPTGAFLEVEGGASAESESNTSSEIRAKADTISQFSKYCNKVTDKATGTQFVCPPGYKAGGKAVCTLTAKQTTPGADPLKYLLPTKKKWPNRKYGTVRPGKPTKTGFYQYKSGVWYTSGLPTFLCSGSALLHGGKSCFSSCSSQGGYCDWCGVGNACCKLGFASDPSECQGLPATAFPKTGVHVCVMPAQYSDTQWFADSTCHINHGESCYSTCEKVGMACDGASFAKIITEQHVERAASQSGLKCASFKVESGSGTFHGPWIHNSNMQCGYHSGPDYTSSCAIHVPCAKSLLCPCKGNYISHHPGQEACPPGYKYIVDAQTCKEAAHFLGSKLSLVTKSGHFGTNGPVGCFQNPGKGSVNFNKDNTGSKVGINSMQYICMGEGSSYINAGTRQNECPVGYMRIKSKALCLAAGKQLHPLGADGISKPYRVQNSPHEPNGCYYKVPEVGGSDVARIHLNLPTLPGSFLQPTEMLICMSETVMAEIESKKAEAATKNFPQAGTCAPGYEPKSGGLKNFGSCMGSWATGYCILPAGEAKRFCDHTPECGGISETKNAAWQKAYPKMQSIGKNGSMVVQAEWKTCLKGPPVDPCSHNETMSLNATEIVKLAKTPANLLEVEEEDSQDVEDESAMVEADESAMVEAGELEQDESETRRVEIGSSGQVKNVGSASGPHARLSEANGGAKLMRRAGGSLEAGVSIASGEAANGDDDWMADAP